MIPNTLAERAVQGARRVAQELEHTEGQTVSQPAVDMRSMDTIELSQRAPSSKEARALLQNPQVRQMAQHLHLGFEHIRGGRFHEAREHFQNKDALKRMGIGTQFAAGQIRTKPPQSADEAKRWIFDAAKQNMAFNTEQGLSIRFSNVSIMDPATYKPFMAKNDAQRAMMKHIQHEEALMAAEENIHTYQNMMGKKNVTYRPEAGQATEIDDEIDIATTFMTHDVPVTKNFLNRYTGRREAAQDVARARNIDPQIWDLVSENGVVVRKRVPINGSSSASAERAVKKPEWANMF